MNRVEDLEKLDEEFTEVSFKAKVDNTYIMLLSSIIERNIKKVQHKISEQLFEKYNNIVENLKNNHEIQMYDELNIKDTIIESIEITNDSYIIRVKLISRYMDYIIDENTKQYKRGINDHRIEKNNRLIFVKRRDAKKLGVTRICTHCGSSIDINSNGICPYCRQPFETVNFDWILTSMEEM